MIAWLFNIHRDPKQGRPRGAADFMPQWGGGEPEEADDGMAPDRIMSVMNGLKAHQEMRERALRRRNGSG